MTREEAIKELELIAHLTVWKDRREAVEMAIEALLDDGTLVVNVKEGKTWQSIVIRAFDRMLENYDGSQNWQTAETKTCYD